MSASFVRRLAAVSLFLSVALPSPVSGPRADDTPAAAGDLWEIVSQMSMEGFPMSMPAQKLHVCAAKNSTEPPGANNEERGCTGSDYVHNEEENSVTWTSVCPDGMSGQGEITFDGDDAYSGEIHYSSDDGNIIIHLSGHRIGDCDNPR